MLRARTVVRDIASVENPKPRPHSYGSHCEVTLRDVRLGSDAMLGGRGDGFVVAQIRLGPGRIHHCMRWIGQATRASMMCERATYRSAHGSLLADKQTIRNFIADSAAEIQALRLMTLHAAWRIDNEGTREARKDIALIKFFGARMLHEVIDRSLQVHGSLGYSSDLPLESMYRAARAARLYDGPDEVHRDTVARQYLKAYAPPPGNVPTEHIPSRRTQALERFADLLADQP